MKSYRIIMFPFYFFIKDILKFFKKSIKIFHTIKMLCIIQSLATAQTLNSGNFLLTKKDETDTNGFLAFYYTDVCRDATPATQYHICGTTGFTIYTASGFYEVDDYPSFPVTSATMPAFSVDEADASNYLLVDTKEDYYIVDTSIKAYQTYDTKQAAVIANSQSTSTFALVTMIMFYIAFVLTIAIFIIVLVNSSCCRCHVSGIKGMFNRSGSV